MTVNNAFEWGNEQGVIGIVDLSTMSYLNEIDLGVDGIITDYPNILLCVLKEKSYEKVFNYK